MTNMLIFGMDAFRMDIVGHWLGGHEPGNFGLLHIARERGVSTALDPRDIPVYAWEDDGPKLTPLDKFERTALLTPYLAEPGEPKFLMVNELYAYAPEAKAACLSGGDRPRLRALGRVPAANGRASLVAEYGLPADLPASLEVSDSCGQRVGVVARGRLPRGVHPGSWSPGRLAAGEYWFGLQAGGVDLLRKVALTA